MLPIVLILLLDNTYPSGLFVPGPMHCAVDSVEVLLASVLSNGAVKCLCILGGCLDGGSKQNHVAASSAVLQPLAEVMIDSDDDGVSWACVRCTFLNHPALRTCECCLLERPLKSSEYLIPTMTFSFFLVKYKCK